MNNIKIITDLSSSFHPVPKVIREKVKKEKPKVFMGNTMEGKFQHGDYENSKGTMYFRSKWEANYALYLDFLIKNKQIRDWEYEAAFFTFDKIRHGTTRYMPDFKVTNNNGSIEYHEIKGYMDARSKTKLKRMAKYYPQVKLILIEKDAYNDIKKKVGKMLNFY